MQINFPKLSTNMAHVLMLADTNRLDGYRNILMKESKGKSVIDFGAGTGVLGIFAANYGAEHVTFIESNSSLHETINSNAKASGLKNFLIKHSIDELCGRDYDLIISEVLGNVAVDESLLEFRKLMSLFPDAIFVPESIEYRYEVLQLDELDNIFREAENNTPGNYYVPKKLTGVLRVKKYGINSDNSKLVGKVNLRKYKDNDKFFNVNIPAIKHGNCAMLWWKAMYKKQTVVSNSPHLFDNGLNHWEQIVFQKNRNFKLIVSLKDRLCKLNFERGEEYTLF